MKADFISSSMAIGILLPAKGAAPSALIWRVYTRTPIGTAPDKSGQ
jgi:hypothetical protein